MSTSSLLTSNAMLRAHGIAALRIVTGIVFTMHGYQKLFDYGI